MGATGPNAHGILKWSAGFTQVGDIADGPLYLSDAVVIDAPSGDYANPDDDFVGYRTPIAFDVVTFNASIRIVPGPGSMGDNELTVDLLRNNVSVASAVLNEANRVVFVLGTFPFSSNDSIEVQVSRTAGSDPLSHFKIACMAGTQ